MVILFEYMHASREIPLVDRSKLAPSLRMWHGDASARWEGDVLNVEVANLNGKSWLDAHGNFASDALRLVERFEMIDADTIEYEATVDDPNVYSQPWKMALRLERERELGFELLEVACHEAPHEQINVSGDTAAH
jgi:hypothetical protein